jgi:hypothetical protein
VCIPAAKTHLGAAIERQPMLGSPIAAAEESAFSPSRINFGATGRSLNASGHVHMKSFGSKLIPYRCEVWWWGGSFSCLTWVCHSNSAACK